MPPLARSRSRDSADEFGTAMITPRNRSSSNQIRAGVGELGGEPIDRNKALGPKGGSRLLASEEAQKQLKKANGLPEGLSITAGVVESSDDSSSSRRGAISCFPIPLSPSPVPDPSHARPTPPVATPTPDDSAATPMPRLKPAPEGSLNELTRRASAEDVAIQENGNGTPARERRASVSRGKAAGLATPFGGAAVAKKEREPEATKYYPPTAATSSRQRTRSNASTSSTGSTNKDVLLTQLADALKKERKKCEMYQKELLVIEEELDEVEQAMSATKEKYEGFIVNQKETIENLRAELKELTLELEHAHDLDAKDAEQYLSLLGPPSPPKTSSQSVISGKTQETRFREEGFSSSPSGKSSPAKSRTVRRLDNLAATASASPDGTPEKPARTSDKPMMSMFRRASKKRSASPSPIAEEQGFKVVERPSRPASPGAPAKLVKAQIRRVPAPAPTSLNLPESAPMKPTKSISRPPVAGLNNSAGVETPRRRKTSLERIGGTLRSMFPPLGAAPTPPAPSLATLDQDIHREANIHAWIKASDLTAIRGDNVGAGYANVFSARS